MSIIGVPELTSECHICCILISSERILNELTMDLLLTRLKLEEVVNKYKGFFSRAPGGLSISHVRHHASHCDKKLVPNDYVNHPELYEEGRTLVDRDIHESPPMPMTADGKPAITGSLVEYARYVASKVQAPAKGRAQDEPPEPSTEDAGKPQSG